jgi:NADPH-dependent 2,4-dienoyl-CoA reductase/sulfur reductase-like enzyme
MKAAAVAAARGHRVSLYERDARPGGQARLAQLLPGRSEFGGLITNLARELALARVEPHLGVEVTRSLVERERPDVVVIATGATPGRWPIEVDAEAHVVDAWAVLGGQVNVGARVVVADWRCDWTGMGLAEHLAQTGCHVRLACNGTMAGQSLQAYLRDAWLARLDRLGVEIITYARLFGADADTVYLQHTASGEAIRCEGVDTLVTSLAPVPSTALEAELEGVDVAVHVIGDCAAPRTAEEAVLEGLIVGASV